MSAQADRSDKDGSGGERFAHWLNEKKVPILLLLGVLALVIGTILQPLPPKPDPVLGETHIERLEVSDAVFAWRDVGPVHHEHAPIVVHFEGLDLPTAYPKAVFASARWPELAEPDDAALSPEKKEEHAKEIKEIIAAREYHEYSLTTTVLETTRDSVSVRVHRADGSSHSGWEPAVRVQVLVIP